MNTIYELITFDVENEHDLEHDLEHKTKFSIPTIFDAKGDISQRWYVYYSFRDPETGKLKRMKNIYGKANRYKTKAERYAALSLYKKRLLRFLREGYDPFEDNTEFHQTKLNETKKLKPKIIEPLVEKPKAVKKEKAITIKVTFERALELKTNVIGEKSLEDYGSRLRGLEAWLKTNHKKIKNINQLNKKIIVEFLNGVQLRSSARNRNNYRTVFSSIFQVLEDNEIIEKNYIKLISGLKTKPTRHKTYTDKEQKAIFKHLETNDPHLLLYIKFMAYSFTRPIEVCRLKVKDVNIVDKTIQFKAKNKALKTKILPAILLKELPDLSQLNKEDFLFSAKHIGGEWKTNLLNRRDHFSKRFKTVKDELGFNDNYGLYSFRHTFITKVYRALVKESSPFEAKSKLMQITGHSTMTALERYLRDIDVELPEDYSNLL
ncbi:tyrosine-type recombinase/integrase [Winogradskyella sp. UBA3174]|uniref:tyrosine-type recombinase/integrase n=1 Tax=Winogradskyella sp. UBA3174 TaxID=1947785 RepID=UPI0025E44D9D|nr:tyrosine-type recombinase/integrase [Winogradskyella sp. UBA3174]|tara:strand:+ start:101848 stop:103146 length:1299 start_codon:yes stop_codon:yes gene_type:complete